MKYYYYQTHPDALVLMGVTFIVDEYIKCIYLFIHATCYAAQICLCK